MYVLLILVVTLSFHLISVSLSKFQFDDKKKENEFHLLYSFFRCLCLMKRKKTIL